MKKIVKIIIIIIAVVLAADIAVIFGVLLPGSSGRMPTSEDLELSVVKETEYETQLSTFLETEMISWKGEAPPKPPKRPEPEATTERPTKPEPWPDYYEPEPMPIPEIPILKKLISLAPEAPPLLFPLPGNGTSRGTFDYRLEYSNMKNNLLTKTYTQEQLDALGEVIPLGKRIITININYETESLYGHECTFSTLTYAKNFGGEWMIGSTGHSSSSLKNLWIPGYSCEMYLHDVNALNPDLESVDWDFPFIIPGYTPVTAFGSTDTPLGMFGELNDEDIIYGKESMPIGAPEIGDAVMLTELNERGPIEIPVKIVNVYTYISGTNVAIVETPNVIDINGYNLGVMDFFKGQSGSPIIQNGKFVAVVAFGKTYLFDGKDEHYNGAIWAADMVSGQLNFKNRIQYFIDTQYLSEIIGTWHDFLHNGAVESSDLIDFGADRTFSLRVNLLEGTGNITGTYEIVGGYIECKVTSRDFAGFAGDDVDEFSLYIDENMLYYYGGDIAEIETGVIFYRYY
ncbi:MAG: hypothetical protein FWD23_12410 [Oscillospiraceae bacterium]|nr:hypothetical protein [Oscillospiraceae bacterium]